MNTDNTPCHVVREMERLQAVLTINEAMVEREHSSPSVVLYLHASVTEYIAQHSEIVWVISLRNVPEITNSVLMCLDIVVTPSILEDIQIECCDPDAT